MRDERGRSPEPQRVTRALDGFKREIRPETPLAEAQAAWPGVVGRRIAEVTEVVEEVDGTLFVDCREAVWAQELSLMEPRIREDLGSAMSSPGPGEIRFRTAS